MEEHQRDTSGIRRPTTPSLLNLLPLLLLAAAAVVSIAAIAYLPERIATRWTLDGQPSQYMDRSIAVWVLPGVMAWTAILLSLLGWSVGGTKEGRAIPGWVWPAVTSMVVGCLLLLHVAVLGIGAGFPVPIGAVVNVAVGLLLLGIGWLMPAVPPNRYLGVRTPGTLSSLQRWRRANEAGGRWMMIAGAVTLAAAPLPAALALGTMLVVIVAACIAAVHAGHKE